MSDREWRPLFSERMAMENMGPVRRRAHIALSRFHNRVWMALWPDVTKRPSRLLPAWAWVWRQYRKTWKVTPR